MKGAVGVGISTGKVEFADVVIANTVAQALQEARLAKKTSPSQLAQRISRKAANIRDYESGQAVQLRQSSSDLDLGHLHSPSFAVFFIAPVIVMLASQCQRDTALVQIQSFVLCGSRGQQLLLDFWSRLSSQLATLGILAQQ